MFKPNKLRVVIYSLLEVQPLNPSHRKNNEDATFSFNDSRKSGSVVVLRSDIDALPILENTNLHFTSKVTTVLRIQ